MYIYIYSDNTCFVLHMSLYMEETLIYFDYLYN